MKNLILVIHLSALWVVGGCGSTDEQLESDTAYVERGIVSFELVTRDPEKNLAVLRRRGSDIGGPLPNRP